MRNPPRILAVDDVPENLEIVQVRLEAEGYEVITATDGDEALARARDSEPDLILLDLSVPYLDGFEIIKALRSDPATRNIPVIVLTGHGDDETYTRARELGAAQLLTKPVERDLLIKAIGGQLGSRQPYPGKK